MGRKLKWVAFSALAFLVWSFDTFHAQPHAIVHECTSDFDPKYLAMVFGAVYTMSSFVFSPKDVGYPASRPRRYTLLLHRKLCVASVPYTLADFGNLSFRNCISTGHQFWECPQHVVDVFLQKLARKKSLPPLQSNGDTWPCRDVLTQSTLMRLLGYERLAKKLRRRASYIVNLQQSVSFMKSLSEFAPTLLTGSSSLWSTRHNRLLAPAQHLVVKGIDLYDSRTDTERFPIELLTLSGQLSDKAILAMAGNGMCLIAVGSVTLFTLGTVSLACPVVSFGPLPLSHTSATEPDGDDLAKSS